MVSFVVKGGRPLGGEVRVSGAKNSVLPLLAATVLAGDECVINDAPDIKDVGTMLRILGGLGAKVWVGVDATTGRRYIRVNSSGVHSYEVPAALMGEMRSSIVLMGALLGRLGKVRVSRPGGCALGPRPINFHINGFTMLGARVREKHGFIDCETPGLVGREIYLDFPSVTATENLMMAAVQARGTTVIHNAAREPEVVDVQNFLNGMGARVSGAGTDAVRVNGTRGLHGSEHTVIPDRIEAGTFLTAAAATGGEVTVTNVVPEHLEAVMAKLREAGVRLEAGGDCITIRPDGPLNPVDVKTQPYPGFPTDMQPQFMALMCFTQGTSLIMEKVFARRFAHVEELSRMGALIDVGSEFAVVRGAGGLTGARVRASDLRAGAALVVAGLGAEGTTVVENAYHIDRGYEKMEEKLAGLGASIRRSDS